MMFYKYKEIWVAIGVVTLINEVAKQNWLHVGLVAVATVLILVNPLVKWGE